MYLGEGWDCLVVQIVMLVFFFNDTATTEIYTLSLHDALPIWGSSGVWELRCGRVAVWGSGSVVVL